MINGEVFEVVDNIDGCFTEHEENSNVLCFTTEDGGNHIIITLPQGYKAFYVYDKEAKHITGVRWEKDGGDD